MDNTVQAPYVEEDLDTLDVLVPLPCRNTPKVMEVSFFCKRIIDLLNLTFCL